MLNSAQTRFHRLFGDEAVLALLERLGKNPRTFNNFVALGVPPKQLDQARQWYGNDAATPVERYAAQRMAGGFFEDESLLVVFCRYFECTDWKLVGSPWFFSKEDYRRCFRAVVDPVNFHSSQLGQGEGEERWGENFVRLPFDLGMDRALISLWDEIGQGQYFWHPQTTYAHLRAANVLGYLYKNVNILHFSPHQFRYNWERNFRRLFEPALHRFRDSLERAVRRWGELRRERTSHRFHYRAYEASLAAGTGNALTQALAYFGLEPATATVQGLNRSFRKLSKQTHPDHGGTPDDFRRLSDFKEVVETWLRGVGRD